jgi:hypothetical protein
VRLRVRAAQLPRSVQVSAHLSFSSSSTCGYGARTAPVLVGIEPGPTALRGLPISWIRYSPCSLPQALVPILQARIGSSGRRSPWAGVALSYRSRFVSNGISNSDE